MSTFKYFVSRDNFLEMPKYSWYLQMLTIIEKFKNSKNKQANKKKKKNSWKIGTPLAGEVKKLTTFGTLTHQVEQLARRWHADHTDTHGTWFSKLTLSQEWAWPLVNNLYFLYFKNIRYVIQQLPKILFYGNPKSSVSCHTLSCVLVRIQ